MILKAVSIQFLRYLNTRYAGPGLVLFFSNISNPNRAPRYIFTSMIHVLRPSISL